MNPLAPQAGGFCFLGGIFLRPHTKHQEKNRRMSSNPIEPRNQGWQVTVPATSANLGCAFDCAGLALRLYLKASFVPSDAPELTVEYAGPHAVRVPLDSTNLALAALRFAAASLGAPSPGGHVVLQNEIPVGAGLGSSAAAVIAGL